jgi:uncharacterized protein involved in copper resistance
MLLDDANRDVHAKYDLLATSRLIISPPLVAGFLMRGERWCVTILRLMHPI